ncbi:Spectrin Beta Chain, Non-Erythrocytic 1 [Manis pentadactyla]|nr:Spectrin Beta Chain, Non-Erythrocytic 1 [Manis pentadactyla]
MTTNGHQAKGGDPVAAHPGPRPSAEEDGAQQVGGREPPSPAPSMEAEGAADPQPSAHTSRAHLVPQHWESSSRPGWVPLGTENPGVPGTKGDRVVSYILKPIPDHTNEHVFPGGKDRQEGPDA